MLGDEPPYRSAPLPMVRFFAAIDDSDVGKLAYAYCGALVKLGCKVRLLASTVANLQVDHHGRSGTPWGKFRSLLMTPMHGSYINLVCTEPEHWGRLWTATMPASSNCMHNVLIATKPVFNAGRTRNYTPQQVMDAWRYQVIAVPTVGISGNWGDHSPSPPPIRFATTVDPKDPESLRTALTPY